VSDATERAQKLARYHAWWSNLSEAERAPFRKRKRNFGRPMRRAWMETRRSAALAEGKPLTIWELKAAYKAHALKVYARLKEALAAKHPPARGDWPTVGRGGRRRF
jgi:hypothetical protein